MRPLIVWPWIGASLIGGVPPNRVAVGPEAFVPLAMDAKPWRSPIYRVRQGATVEFRGTQKPTTGYVWSEPTYSVRGVLAKPDWNVASRPSTRRGPPKIGGGAADVTIQFHAVRPGRTIVEIRRGLGRHDDLRVRFLVWVTR